MENEVADIIGVDATIALMKEFSGVDFIQMPKLENMYEGHRIAVAIGFEKACELADAMCGDRILVTNLDRRIREHQRKQDLLEAVVSGDEPGSQIAAKFGVSARWVRLLADRYGVVLPHAATRRRAITSSIVRSMVGGKTTYTPKSNVIDELLKKLDPNGVVAGYIADDPNISSEKLVQMTKREASEVKKIRTLLYQRREVTRKAKRLRKNV